MKIKSIKVSNYKSLGDVYVPFNGNYCAISGKNNSGKSNIIRLLSILLNPYAQLPWEMDLHFDYESDCSQWNFSYGKPIIVEYEIILSKLNDISMIDFIKKFIKDVSTYTEGDLILKITVNISPKNSIEYNILLDGKEVTPKEVIKKLKNSGLLSIHNSTQYMNSNFMFPGRLCFGLDYTQQEADKLKQSIDNVIKQVARISKSRKDKLQSYLGELKEPYSVEFSLLGSMLPGKNMPFDVLLKSDEIKVPLSEWGSGTQNKTATLMSLMNACNKDDKDAVPVFIIEEPESFLHPSAQAEFGSLIRKLSEQNGMQVIVTTHSPHMLNISKPDCNILLSKKTFSKRKGSHSETIIKDTSGNNWMKPFAEHLGFTNETFSIWSNFLGLGKQKVLLVEGETDFRYLKHIQSNNFPCGTFSNDVEIVNYNGIGALKNNVLLKFILSKFDSFFILFDKDVKTEVERELKMIGLKEKVHYLSVGMDEPGKRHIEGLLPDSLQCDVETNNRDIVVACRSEKKDEKRKAIKELKIKYCDAFCSKTNFDSDELKNFKPLIKCINAVFK